jgi:TonB C terminal
MRLLCSSFMLFSFAFTGLQGQQASPQRIASESIAVINDGVEVLSDTNGVDVNPYMRRVLADIYKNWLPLIPQRAKPPESKQGEALIRFKIMPDGKIGAMWLDGSTHDDAINRSCWGSITSEGQFPPLPAGLETRPLVLRIHFYVNTKPQGATATSSQQ